ncbi:MAG: antitoxin family protein [Phycisphaerae bacterium]
MITTVEGIVENGAIRLRDPIELPDNTRVFVIIPDATPPAQIRTPRLANPQQAADFRKQVLELPRDAKL